MNAAAVGTRQARACVRGERPSRTFGFALSNSDKCVGNAFFWRDGGLLDPAMTPDGSISRAMRSNRVGDGCPSTTAAAVGRVKCADEMRGIGAKCRLASLGLLRLGRALPWRRRRLAALPEAALPAPVSAFAPLPPLLLACGGDELGPFTDVPVATIVPAPVAPRAAVAPRDGRRRMPCPWCPWCPCDLCSEPWVV